ncbi:EAL domain-containing protein [Vibrio sp. TH_r3]|uniref:two-component system response regulator n=1 Tax=Vibrio sp. TH_r3 TaxID=3082084 RepID=UPI002953773F|nr:EAL domain-containing protein [Vibrio sp. TH_r3]MDV7105876.1 EAL domain-containing protein [Vibrio sp. TH_r3]
MANESKVHENKILIVDDDPSVIHILKQSMRELGKLYFATNGSEAIQLAATIKPDLVLLDIQMPDLDGYQVYNVLKDNSELKYTSIMFITSQGDSQSELKALEMGAVDFIQKPINQKIARARVKTQLALKEEQRNLKLARSTLDTIIYHLPVFVSYWDEHAQNVFSNDYDGYWFGLDTEELLKKNFMQVIQGCEGLNQNTVESLSLAVEALPLGTPLDIDFTLTKTADNSKSYQDVNNEIFVTASLVPTLVDGVFKGFVMLLNDITPLKALQVDLHQDKELLRVTLNSIGDAVITTDITGKITFMNPIAESLTGWSNEAALTQSIERVMPLKDASRNFELNNPIYTAMGEKRVVGMAFNTTLVGTDNTIYEVEDSAAPILDTNDQVLGGIIVFHDVSEARAMSLKMTHLANHDALTGLPNRMLLQDRARYAIDSAKDNEQLVAMLILDVDNFKHINDAMGHAVGDTILKYVADRLGNITRNVDTLSRQGGDEFTVILTQIDSQAAIINYLNKIKQTLSDAFILDGERYEVSCSIGVSIFPDDAQNVEELYKHSDTAMNLAKAKGKNGWHFFSGEMAEQMSQRHEIEKYLRYALQESLFEVHYQPKVDVSNHAVVGVEALLRLKSAQGEPIPPGLFIPIAEECGLIVQLGAFVLEQVCKDANQWQADGLMHIVSLNISTLQFNDDDFMSSVKNIFEKYSNLNLNLIEFEITEGVLAKSIEKTRQKLMILKKMGIKISIDDFGTGYSSFTYIKKFPIDTIKIDQSFVRDIFVDPSDKAIVRAIINFGKALDLKLVAEGAETKKQVDFLVDNGCDIVQGYYYSKPIPYNDTTAFIHEFQK